MEQEIGDLSTQVHTIRQKEDRFQLFNAMCQLKDFSKNRLASACFERACVEMLEGVSERELLSVGIVRISEEGKRDFYHMVEYSHLNGRRETIGTSYRKKRKRIDAADK